MSLVLGKNTTQHITKTIDLYEPIDAEHKRKAGSVRVTVRILPRSEFLDLIARGDDVETAQALIDNIVAADSTTQVPPFEPGLIKDLCEVSWQIAPILTWAIDANHPNFVRGLAEKN